MAIGVRDITNLEELLEVQDDDKIIVIQNGEAKLISKANAKFGGGSVTVFYPDPNDKSNNYKRLVDVNGNLIGAQVAYDAIMSGTTYLGTPHFENSGETGQELTAIESFSFIWNNGKIISVILSISNGFTFCAGSKPIN